MTEDPPELPGSSRLGSLLEEIRGDRSRGSRQLNTRLIQGLVEWSRQIDGISREQIRELCERIRDLRPEMAAIAWTGYRLWEQAREQPSDLTPTERLRAGLKNIQQQYGDVTRKMVENLRDEGLRDRSIMTFSRSGTILELLGEYSSIRSVTVLHSYPGEEGTAMAVNLVNEVESLTFAYDAEAGTRLPRVDALYLGADSLLDDGSVVNKTGSRLLASAARSTPVRVAVESWKYSPAESAGDGPAVDSPEDLPASLKRRHPLFETVPAHFIDSYITDRGVFHSPQHLHWKLDDLRRAHEHLD